MKCNPLITRFRYSTLRRSRFSIYMTVYGVTLTVLFFINYSLYRYAGAFADAESLFNALFVQLLTVQVLILVFWTCYNTAGAIPSEVSGKSYDFFRLLPLSPAEKSLGIMIGRNLAALLIGAVNVLLLAVSAFLGRISPAPFAQYLFALLGTAALMNTVGLLWSQRLKGGRGRDGALGHVILLIIFALSFLAFVSDALPGIIGHRVHFYGLRLPALPAFSFLTLYLAFWAFAGTMRRFRAETEPLFSRVYAIIFLILCQMVIFGFIGRYMAESRPAAALFYMVAALVLGVVTLLSFRNQHTYHELAGALHARRHSCSKTFAGILLRSNVVFSVMLFAAWLAVSLAFLTGSAAGFVDSLHLLAVTLTAYIFLVFLLEIYMLYSSGPVRTGMLVFLFIALYFMLPWVIGGIMGRDAVFGLSPVALPWFLGEGPPYETPLWLIGAYNIALSVPPAAIILNRYKSIVNAHV